MFALTEDQKTLVKASYGVYWDSPGFTLANLGNPNPNNNFTRYEGSIRPELQRRGASHLRRPPAARPGNLGVRCVADYSPAVTYDPDLKNQFAHSASVFFEHELGANFGVRTGFVWNGVRNQRTTVNTNQPFEAFDGR